MFHMERLSPCSYEPKIASMKDDNVLLSVLAVILAALALAVNVIITFAGAHG